VAERGLCKRCKVKPIERIGDWESDYCGKCNDQLIYLAEKRKEWAYYHPGEPAPKEENDE